MSRKRADTPTHILFVRNIAYTANESEVENLFKPFGEIARFFPLIEKRGLAFVTFFDRRCSEAALKSLEGSEIAGRPIDVHYSWPKDPSPGGDPHEQNSGLLKVSLKNAGAVNDDELRRYFEQFGEVSEVRPIEDGRPNQRFVEFYDTRHCKRAYEECQRTPYPGATLAVEYALIGPQDISPHSQPPKKQQAVVAAKPAGGQQLGPSRGQPMMAAMPAMQHSFASPLGGGHPPMAMQQAPFPGAQYMRAAAMGPGAAAGQTVGGSTGVGFGGFGPHRPDQQITRFGPVRAHRQLAPEPQWGVYPFPQHGSAMPTPFYQPAGQQSQPHSLMPMSMMAQQSPMMQHHMPPTGHQSPMMQQAPSGHMMQQAPGSHPSMMQQAPSGHQSPMMQQAPSGHQSPMMQSPYTDVQGFGAGQQTGYTSFAQPSQQMPTAGFSQVFQQQQQQQQPPSAAPAAPGFDGGQFAEQTHLQYAQAAPSFQSSQSGQFSFIDPAAQFPSYQQSSASDQLSQLAQLLSASVSASQT